ncbi:HAD family phosphatase [Sphingobacteriaceae bacterium WQ 2009]|uniref:HAD family phosphatase n=1 Tax=Rhinopithecimicrobium faecis TaxID=2820698 RepID=A0A8T4H824_9SPHI|nr:HAD family phosphatase [Sphingobacteriaceae bacterium WQ 2009]
MNKLSAVLFDFDGTLIDSERFYFEAWGPILSQDFQLEITFDDWIASFAGHTLQRNVQFLKSNYGIETTDEHMWKRTREAYADQDLLSIQLMPFAGELISYLAENHIQIGLVTSNFKGVVSEILKNHKLYNYFNFFVTREDVQEPKPKPECYLRAQELCHVPASEILVIEDTVTGASAALAANLTCFGVSKHAAERSRLAKSVPLFDDLQQVYKELAESGY